jgi:hypothetical protein
MAKLGTLKLTGASGTVYDFDVYSADTVWNANYPCVYCASHRAAQADGTGNHTPIYIGQTGDIKNRHVDHHRQKCFDSHNCNAISVHPETNEQQRLVKEHDLIRSLDPPCNR